jgi:hypothetical protein
VPVTVCKFESCSGHKKRGFLKRDGLFFLFAICELRIEADDLDPGITIYSIIESYAACRIFPRIDSSESLLSFRVG